MTTLTRRDRDLRTIVTEYGPPPLWARRPGYATLVHIILGQQVSLASAEAANTRLRSLVGRITPHNVLRQSHASLTRVGLTRQKARYCRTLAEAIVNRELDLRDLANAPSDDVETALTNIVGIGRWTADIYQLMALGRPDIWPRGDLAIYVAMRERMRLDLDARALDNLADRWRPYRAVAARLLWHDYLSRRRHRQAD